MECHELNLHNTSFVWYLMDKDTVILEPDRCVRNYGAPQSRDKYPNITHPVTPTFVTRYSQLATSHNMNWNYHSCFISPESQVLHQPSQ